MNRQLRFVFILLAMAVVLPCKQKTSGKHIIVRQQMLKVLDQEQPAQKKAPVVEDLEGPTFRDMVIEQPTPESIVISENEDSETEGEEGTVQMLEEELVVNTVDLVEARASLERLDEKRRRLQKALEHHQLLDHKEFIWEEKLLPGDRGNRERKFRRRKTDKTQPPPLISGVQYVPDTSRGWSVGQEPAAVRYYFLPPDGAPNEFRIPDGLHRTFDYYMFYTEAEAEEAGFEKHPWRIR